MDVSELGRDTAGVVALKSGELAKSRLGSLPDPLRRRLAWTMALDTLRALSAAVAHLVVVGDQPSLQSRLGRAGVRVEVLPEAGPGGMNQALGQGFDRLRASGFVSVLACVGDLPALRAESVRKVLASSTVTARSFVPDVTGVGTTMLITHGAELDPRFQGRSAAAHHHSGARRLGPEEIGAPVADARRDVDTEADLADATRLGLGASTSALIDPATARPGTYQVITTTTWRAADETLLAVTSSGRRMALASTALADGLHDVRLGQRLHAVTTEGRVLSAWM